MDEELKINIFQTSFGFVFNYFHGDGCGLEDGDGVGFGRLDGSFSSNGPSRGEDE